MSREQAKKLKDLMDLKEALGKGEADFVLLNKLEEVLDELKEKTVLEKSLDISTFEKQVNELIKKVNEPIEIELEIT